MPAAPLTTTITTIIAAAATTTPSAAPSGAAAVPFGAWLAIGLAGAAVIAGLATLFWIPAKKKMARERAALAASRTPQRALNYAWLRSAEDPGNRQKDTQLCIIFEDTTAPAVAADVPKPPAAAVVADPEASGAADPSRNPSLKADGVRFLLASANFRLAPAPQELSEDDPGHQHPQRQRWMSRMAERAVSIAKDSKGQ